MIFKDRFDAAQQLAPQLKKYQGAPDTSILAIPRGSLQIGYELSRILHLPLDIVVTKKIPAPGSEEAAIGAISPDGKVFVDKNTLKLFYISEDYIKTKSHELLKTIAQRYEMYRQTAEIPSFKDKTVILIDDGIATGFTIKSAIAFLRRDQVKKLIVAVPVALRESAEEMRKLADEFICLSTPDYFIAVSQFYEFFPQVSDEEAIKYLKAARRSP